MYELLSEPQAIHHIRGFSILVICFVPAQIKGSNSLPVEGGLGRAEKVQAHNTKLWPKCEVLIM